MQYVYVGVICVCVCVCVCFENAGPSGRAVKVIGLRPLACWGCGFESRRGHGCLSAVSVVRYRFLQRPVHLCRGVLPTMVRRCVWSRNLMQEEATWPALGRRARGERVSESVLRIVKYSVILKWNCIFNCKILPPLLPSPVRGTKWFCISHRYLEV